MAEQQHVVQRLAALLGRADEDLELLAGLGLPHVLVEHLGPQGALQRLLLRCGRCGADDAHELAAAVAAQEAGRLVKVPGIGKKTRRAAAAGAQGQSSPTPSSATGPAPDAGSAKADILQALVALGYSDKEAQAAVKALTADASVSDGIKLALKALKQVMGAGPR